MRIGITLIPSGDWEATLAAARTADDAGLDAIGIWDHFHSNNPDEALIGGWSLYGTLAMATSRIRLVPMVLNQLSYPINVLARESSTLATVSGGRFELGIGLGGWKGEHTIWGLPFPDAATRMAMLEEKVLALRALWRGEPVTMAGGHIALDGATIRPVPPVPPRVVVGSSSRLLIGQAVRWADELNLLGSDPALVRFALERIADSGRDVALSTSLFVSDWTSAELDRLAQLEEMGLSRVFINVPHPYGLITTIGDAGRELGCDAS